MEIPWKVIYPGYLDKAIENRGYPLHWSEVFIKFVFFAKIFINFLTEFFFGNIEDVYFGIIPFGTGSLFNVQPKKHPIMMARNAVIDKLYALIRPFSENIDITLTAHLYLKKPVHQDSCHNSDSILSEFLCRVKTVFQMKIKCCRLHNIFKTSKTCKI